MKGAPKDGYPQTKIEYDYEKFAFSGFLQSRENQNFQPYLSKGFFDDEREHLILNNPRIYTKGNNLLIIKSEYLKNMNVGFLKRFVDNLQIYVNAIEI